jgi:hypothetical protein
MHNRQSPDTISRETLAQLQQLSDIMDRAFTIPGTNIRFGLDSILGLIPVLGDTLAMAVSAYIYSFAKKAGVPWYQRTRMVWNIFIDWLIGLVPFFGDIFDVGFKANSKNVRIIMAHVEKKLNADIIEGDYERMS